jgi:hypothetical protein
MAYLLNMYVVVELDGHRATTDAEATAGQEFDESVKWAWCNNLGNAIIEEFWFKMNSTSNYLEKLTTDTMNIESQMEISKDKKYGYDKLVGNVPELCEMRREHEETRLYIPLNLFFSDHPSVSFPSLSIQN